MDRTSDRIRSRPRWEALYALTAATLTLLGVVETFIAPGAWRRALDIGVTVLVFVTIHLWVRANRRALDLVGGAR